VIIRFPPRNGGPVMPPGASLTLDGRQAFEHPSRMTADGDRIMSTADLCMLYGVSRETIRRWVADGLELAPETPIKPSGRPVVQLFRASVVAAFLEARKARPRAGRGPDKAPRKPGRWKHKRTTGAAA